VSLRITARLRQLAVAGICSITFLSGCVATPAETTTTAVWTERGPITFAVAGDSSGVWAQLIATWNKTHANEQVTLRELSTDPKQRHDELATAAKASRGEFAVTALDSAWLPEFASNDWLASLATADFPTTGLLASSVSAASYQGTTYGLPVTADVGVLYYRKDLLAAAGVKAPTSWDELKYACDKVLATHSNLNCYGTGLRSAQSLTTAASEAIYSAGGDLVGTDATSTVDSTAAVAGVSWLAAAANKGTIPSAALGWQDDQVAKSFADGKLVFARGWTTSWSTYQASSGSTVVGRVGVVQLPGQSGVGVAASAGLQLTVSKNARNGATAADFMRWLDTDEVQRKLVTQGSFAPVVETLYTNAEMIKVQPNLTTVAAALKTAKAAPVTVHYAEMSAAMSDAIYPVVEGKAEAAKVLPDLQSKLTGLLK
jgi:multiple sugar transport system substrate-binding protein